MAGPLLQSLLAPWLTLSALPGGTPRGKGDSVDAHHKSLGALWLGLGADPTRYDSGLDALCKRLGVERLDSEILTWLAVGLELAKEQPEFRQKRMRGRPRLNELTSGVDFQRAKAVKALRKQKEAEGVPKKPRDNALIKELAESGHPDFPKKMELYELASSVSRGNKRWKEFKKKVEQRGAEIQRLERKLVTLRADHERRTAPSEGGLLSGLFDQAQSGLPDSPQ